MKGPVVDITDGKIQGVVSKNYLGGKFYEFLGVPYGKPPIGDLRFKAPHPVESWSGVLDATKQGAVCPSWHIISRRFIGDEAKCLNLNIYSKEVEVTNTAKPVMVFIHGGSFAVGSNAKEFFGPEYLMTEDIVLVAVNYRLGFFGFLCFDDQSLDVPGNAGIKDIILALKWVQRNIVFFNGDPNNVTCFGSSSGAALVDYLSISPLSKGLFHKVILQSGCALNPWAKGKANGRHLAKLLNYEEEDETKIFHYLSSIGTKQITEALHKDSRLLIASYHRYVAPVIEQIDSASAVIAKDPKEILKNGTFHQVPMMIGYNNNEGGLFEFIKNVSPEHAKIAYSDRVHIPYELCLKKDSQEFEELSLKLGEFYNHNASQMLTDTLFMYGIHKTIEYRKQKTEASIYLYRMSLDTSLNFLKKLTTTKFLILGLVLLFLTYVLNLNFLKKLFLKYITHAPKTPTNGVLHTEELSYLFKNFIFDKLRIGSIEEVSVRRLVKLWTNFARTGNPTPDNDNMLDNVEWKPVTPTANNFLEIDRTLSVGVNPENDRMKFWDSVYAKYNKSYEL